MAGLSFYQRKPGHHELGWLRRCACCSELGPRAEGPDREKSLWLANTIHAIFCSSERCDQIVRCKLREIFGELVPPASPGALPQCALCGRFERCNTVRLGEETIAWVCSEQCHGPAQKMIVDAWPHGLPYVDDNGHPTERPLFDRADAEEESELDEITDIIDPPTQRVELPSPGELLRGMLGRPRRAWTRGVVWLPEPAKVGPHACGWLMQASFRPFALFLWSGVGLCIRDLRVNGEPQLIAYDGSDSVEIPSEQFSAGVSIERFRQLVSAPGKAEGNFATISDRNWRKLLVEGGQQMYLELPTLIEGHRLQLGLSGEYSHGCIVGKCLAVDRVAAERGEA